MKTTVINRYLYDPEMLIKFAVVPVDFPQSMYAQAWDMWLQEYARTGNDPETRADLQRAKEEIAKRQNGWCSIANIEEAGFTSDGRRMLSLEETNAMVQPLREVCMAGC